MDFTSKLSLYDILTMLVSGFLILALFIPENTSLQENLIFVIIFSYLLGIIYHRLLECIRGCECIKKLTSPCFLLGVIFQINFYKALLKAKKRAKNYEQYNGSDIKEKYYDCYYSIMDKPAYGTIRTLETQEAFLRNITWVLVMYLIFYHSEIKFFDGNLFAKIFFINPITNCNCLVLIINIVIFVLPILFARYHTQMSVYKAVWEAGKHNNIEKKVNDIENKVNNTKKKGKKEKKKSEIN